MKLKKSEIVFAIGVIVLIVICIIVLALPKSNEPVDDEPEESAAIDEDYDYEEPEESEPSISGVPEGQVDADKDRLLKGDNVLKAAFKNTSEGTFLRREIEHDYDEYAHIDNATIHYYFDTWLGVVDMAKPCAYQYSRDSDIWSLLSCEDSEVADVEYNANAIAVFDGGVLDVEKYTGSYIGETTFYRKALTIESIDTSSYPLKVTVSYSFDTFDSDIGYLSDNTTMYMKAGGIFLDEWWFYGEHDIENSTYSSLGITLRLLHSEEGYFYDARLNVK